MASEDLNLSGFLSSCKHHYLCNYIKSSENKCRLRNGIFAFKNDSARAIEFWTEHVIKLIQSELSEFITEKTLIVRALGHNETSVPDLGSKALDKLGLAIAERFGGTYLPSTIYKTRKTKQVKYLSKKDRVLELTDVFKISDKVDISEFDSIIVLDDISTTGTTLKLIINLLRNRLKLRNSKCKALTIAKTDTSRTLNEKFLKSIGL
jgi:hypothetical protein